MVKQGNIFLPASSPIILSSPYSRLHDLCPTCFHAFPDVSTLPNFRTSAPRDNLAGNGWVHVPHNGKCYHITISGRLTYNSTIFHIYVWGWVKRSIGHLISGGWEPGWTDQPYIFWICLDYSSIKSDISLALTCSHCSLTDSVTYVWANILGWR